MINCVYSSLETLSAVADQREGWGRPAPPPYRQTFSYFDLTFKKIGAYGSTHQMCISSVIVRSGYRISGLRPPPLDPLVPVRKQNLGSPLPHNPLRGSIAGGKSFTVQAKILIWDISALPLWACSFAVFFRAVRCQPKSVNKQTNPDVF